MLVCNVSMLQRVYGKLVAAEAADIAAVAGFASDRRGTLAATDALDIAALGGIVATPVQGALAATGAADAAALTGNASSGTGPGTWTPATYATAPFYWFDASDAATITQTAGAVSQWNDKSTHNNHITQATGANQPIRTAAAYNGLATITFNGTTSRMNKSSGLTAPTGAGTLFAVLKATSASAGNVYWTTNGSVLCGVHVMSTANARYQCSSNNHANYVPPANLVLHSGYITPSRREIFAKGISQNANTTGTDTNNTPTQIWFGSDSNPVTFFKGDLCEIIMVPGATPMSAADRQLFEGYLGWKWDATAALLDVTHPYKTHGPDV